MASRPTPEMLQAAYGTSVPDLIRRGLKVLFCGINPSLYSAAVGHHFGRPGNRFWPTLHAAGFSTRRLLPEEEGELLKAGYGITNVVARATATAAELADAEMLAGGEALLAKVRRYRPRVLAVLGVGAFRVAWKQPRATTGLQPESIGTTKIWVLPNPSGLNANYQLPQLTALFRALREAVE